MVFWRKSKSKEKDENLPEDEAAQTDPAADTAEETTEPAADEKEATGKEPKAKKAKKAAEELQPQTLEEITPNIRRRLQQFYVVGKKNLDTGNVDYALSMLQQPVFGDPANLEYAQTFFDALHKKYESPKKVGAMASLQGMPIKGAMKKAASKKQWRDVIKSGTDMMLVNPYDIPALCSIAEACEQLEADEAQLFYLRAALKVNPKDPKLNKLAALALARIGDFGQAIVCWHRVEEHKPGDEEALKMISQLTAERTIPKDKMVESKKPLNQKKTETSAAVPASSKTTAPKETKAPEKESKSLTREEQLMAKISADPAEKENYVELADYFISQNQFQKAEQTLSKALAVAGPGDLALREKLEDFQIMRASRQVDIAEHRARQEKTAEAASLVKKMRIELNRVELDVFTNRCERAPNNDSYRYELGVRLKRAGKFKEAIENLQKCQGEGKRKAMVHLELGDCFQCIKVHKLAMDNYEKSIEGSRDKELEVQKKSLYRAGVLATDLNDLSKAEEYLTELAGLDFGYRDVAARLDKISQTRNDG